MSEESTDKLDEFRKEEANHAILRLLRDHGRGEFPQFILGGVAGVISRGMELVPAFILGVTVDALFFDSKTFSLPFIPTGWIPTTTENQLFLAIGIIGSAYLLGAVLDWVNSWAWNHFAQHLQHSIRTATYDAMQQLEIGFFDTKQTGEVMSILNNDVNQLEGFLTNSLNSGIRIVVRVGGMGLVMLLMNWQLALIPVFIIPILGVVSFKFVELIHPKYQEVRSTVGALNSRLENNLGGIEVLKAYNTQAFESQRVSDASEDYLEAQWDAISTRIKFFPALRLITAAGYLATFIIGGIWVINGPPAPFSGALTAGTLVTFLLYSRRFMWPMRQFGQVINDYQYARAAGERIAGLMDRTDQMERTKGTTALESIEGTIDFEDVSFRYEEADHPVLENVSFHIDAGEFVGIVGPTGAGKTTLVKLLMRFYDPTSGTIRLDGNDLESISINNLRSHISFVSQEPYLFYGTVKENIAYGLPEADTEAIREAATRAGALEFIEALDDGFDTMVGERGVKLSGGQRQRISIARAILRDPEILILDEATSHVDNETEIMIQEQLEELVADRTTFAIAHRLSTVRGADHLLVLDEGRLIEEGTHESLLAADGLYANLWRVQVGEVDELPEAFLKRSRTSHLIEPE